MYIMLPTITNERQTMAYNKNTKKPTRECKVCIDAGKSPEECASHYVKDLSGNVTCPTLLNQKCLLCGVCGHTASYCKTKATKAFTTTTKTTTTTTMAMKSTPVQPQPKPTTRPQSSNKYAILGLLEAEAEQANEQRIAAFPPLEPKPVHLRPQSNAAVVQTPATPATSAISSWANRLKSPPLPVSQQPEEPQRRKLTKPTKPVAIAVLWADY
jgi:hypothetical protein